MADLNLIPQIGSLHLRKANEPLPEPLPDDCRNISITLKIPRLGNQSVSDTWSLAKIVREVELKLLQVS